MRQVKNKSKFYIYKDVKEYTFPPDRVWKIWVPLPETMFGGTWLQSASFEDAVSFTENSANEIRDILANLFDDGGW